MDIITEQKIKNLIQENMIMIFMKGDKDQPQCGFSNTVIQIFNSLKVDYTTFNVLEDPNMRNAIKEYSKWPTIPQVYINGEFLGGTDITFELYKTKELLAIIEAIRND